MKNLEFRLGDLQDPPVAPASVDLAILSQALHHAQDPARAIASAARILKPGGQIMILDLARHRFERARKLYGDHCSISISISLARSRRLQHIETAGCPRRSAAAL